MTATRRRGRPGVARGRSEDREGPARADRRGGAGPVVDGGPAQPVHQDPRDTPGPPCHHPVPVGGDQRQRHTDLLARSGTPRSSTRSSRAWSRRPRPGATWPRSPPWPRSSSAGWTPRWTAGSTRSARRRPPSFAARRRSPTRGSPTSFTSRGSASRGGRRCALRARTRSARCGRRQAPRTRRTTTRGTSSTLSRPGSSTRCPSRPSRPSPTTRSCAATRSRAHTTRHARSSRTSKSSASGTTTSLRCSSSEGVEKFSASWAELLGTIEKEMARVRGSSQGQASGR